MPCPANSNVSPPLKPKPSRKRRKPKVKATNAELAVAHIQWLTGPQVQHG